MSRRAKHTGPAKKPANGGLQPPTNKRSSLDYLQDYLDTLLLRPDATLTNDDLIEMRNQAAHRFTAYAALGTSDIDWIAIQGRRLFKTFRLSPPAASGLERLGWALRACWQVAVLAGEQDLSDILDQGINALEERERGYDEPLLRAAPKKDHREPFRARRVKMISADAYWTLSAFGAKDAAKLVAKVVREGDHLPPPLHDRSVRNWRRRGQAGQFPVYLQDLTLFDVGRDLWRDGRPNDACKAVLDELKFQLDQLPGK